MAYNHISQEKIVDYTLGHLTEEEKIDIEGHLFTCEECLEEWQGWQEVLRESEEKRAPSPYVKQRVMNDIEGHGHKQKRPFMQKPAYAIISICMLLIIFLTINQLSGQEKNMVYTEGTDNRTVHPYPLDQEESVLKMSHIDQFSADPTTHSLNMIWVHNIENRPIVYVNEQDPKQLLDCQYMIVFEKQDWRHPLRIIRDRSKEIEDIYLRCVR